MAAALQVGARLVSKSTVGTDLLPRGRSFKTYFRRIDLSTNGTPSDNLVAPESSLPGVMQPTINSSGRRSSDRQGGRRISDRRPRLAIAPPLEADDGTARLEGASLPEAPSPTVINQIPLDTGSKSEIENSVANVAGENGAADSQGQNAVSESGDSRNVTPATTEVLPTSRDDAAVLALFRRLRGPAHLARNNDPISLRDHLVLIHTPLV
ncbi:MAG: hypothetical protein JWN98_1754, partial [Abditibacteriota bacterium]|nr:hypothetical protein [Abditibacteriota bacterium]